MIKELSWDKARKKCPSDLLNCDSTEELNPLVDIIGQERAVEALQFGLDIPEEGFNVFVSGEPGTGKKTAIMNFLGQKAKSVPPPSDWCYVNNFKDSNSPKALRLPPGKGAEFRDDINKFIDEMKKSLDTAFESEDYTARREETLQQYEEKKQELWSELNKKARDADFVLQRSQIGILIVPVINGQMINEQQFSILPQSVKDEIQGRRKKLQDELRSALLQFRNIDREAEEEIEQFNREVASFALEPLLAALKDKYSNILECNQFLDAIKNDVLENLMSIISSQEQEKPFPFLMGQKVDPLERYNVNLIVDNRELEGAPVIMEMNPTHDRLFGAVEKEARFGALVTDYTMIRAGSLHKANGGFLVVQVEDLLRSPGAYESLKRTIVNKKLEIEDLASRMGFISTRSLRPEPIPYDTKVVLVGDPQLYYTLFQLDPEFKKIFKVKAEFDTSMERNDENVRKYAQFMCTLSGKEGLLHLESSGIASVVEFSSRLASDQNRLSTEFQEISDVIREANYYAKKDGDELIKAEHVKRAIESKVYRSNLIEEKLRKMIENGSILVDTKGARVGQVNGLAVLGLGNYMFGKPSRITASVGIGKKGIIDIEREAEMGGPTHTKGVHILTGFMTNRYARDNPLNLTARLTFEQSYSGVDGDSASSTETYALLSALSDIPIKQGLAVTGSVNQKGEVQSIGGVNQKIEGFFDLCKIFGLNGQQGVVIPKSNVQNLMLKEDVIDAIKEGKFHIYPVNTIDEGIEILTGVPAGELKENGTWTEDSINYLVQKKLDEMAKKSEMDEE
ncbi:AAA family ATPase [Candidatus Bathyarchaeota archaeon]|nr:AAA family ATPase [Candidatus Bathyarchaeota archaeon]